MTKIINTFRPWICRAASITLVGAVLTVPGVSWAESVLGEWQRWIGSTPQATRAETRRYFEQQTAKHSVDELQEALIDRSWRLDYQRLQDEIADSKHWERVAPTAYRREALVLSGEDRDPTDIVLRRTRALLKDLQTRAADRKWDAQSKQLAELESKCKTTPPEQQKARFDCYMVLCRLRRELMWRDPLLDFGQLLFVKRHRARFQHMCDQFFGHNGLPGGGVFVLDKPFSSKPVVRNLTAGMKVSEGRLKGTELAPGTFLSPELSFDAKTVLFAYSELKGKGQTWCPENSYHVFRAGIDGADLRQLTDGCWNEFDPCFLPNGKVAFISERRGGYGRCHGRPVPTYTLYRMNADGSGIECLSYHETNEWQPVVNNDGRIVYTRWDYVDRNPNGAHGAWVTTPDGRDPRAIYGNYFKHIGGPRAQMTMDIRPIPGTKRYIATGAAHHGFAFGSLVIFDPQLPEDGWFGGGWRVTPEISMPETEQGAGSTPWSMAYGTAWPLDADHYLCCYDEGNGGTDYGLCYLDSFGNRELIYLDPAISCISPIPITARPVPPVVPELSQTRPVVAAEKPITDKATMTSAPASALGDQNSMGAFALMNVYNSRKPLPANTKITALRVIQVLMKSTAHSEDPQIAYDGGAAVIAARQVLGTVPVEPDGSAYFQAPIHKLLYFQALDKDGLAVQSMRSGTYLQQGDLVACAGCHEPQGSAVQVQNRPLAMKHPPSPITPEPVEGVKPFSYPRLVQPVLDQHCVKCHEENRAKKAPDLRGREGLPTDSKAPTFTGRQFWYPSYVSLKNYTNRAPLNESETVPGKFGARGSRLLAMIQAGHHGVQLKLEELHRLTLWMDCNSAFYGSQTDAEGQAMGKVVQARME